MNNTRSTWPVRLAGVAVGIALFSCTSACFISAQKSNTASRHSGSGVVLVADGVAPSPVPPPRKG